jgi:hypothetical protein
MLSDDQLQLYFLISAEKSRKRYVTSLLEDSNYYLQVFHIATMGSNLMTEMCFKLLFCAIVNFKFGKKTWYEVKIAIKVYSLKTSAQILFPQTL